jgi:nicotinamide-nucleotide amidase
MEKELHILYIGDRLRFDTLLQGYVRRECARRGWVVGRESFLPALVAETPLTLQEELSRSPRHLLLADGDAFALVGRILSTLGDTTLQLSAEGILVPATASEVGPSGYTVTLEGREVHVALSRADHPFPTLPLPERGTRCYQYFARNEAEAKALRRALLPLQSDGIFLTPIAPGWERLCACGESAIGRLEERLSGRKLRLLPFPSLVQALIHYLGEQGRTLTFAESCTGGRLAAAVTAHSGSSAILEGSWVTYANRIKEGWLGVRAETLERHGAVSEACVREMAAGAQRRVGAEIAVAISGIAGPTGAVPGKPVGTVWFGLRNGSREFTELKRFQGDRNAVQEQAVRHALKMIVESEEKIFEFFSENP